MPKKTKPRTKVAVAKPAKAKAAAKPKAGGASKLHAWMAGLSDPIATIEHGGFAHRCHVWGKRWLVTTMGERSGQFEAGPRSFMLVDTDGTVTDRVTYDKANISKTFIAGNELVALHDEPPATRIEVFRQTPAGKLERVASRRGDQLVDHLWGNEERMIAIGDRLLVTQDRDRKSLLVYALGPDFTTTKLGEMKVVFGEKMEFVDTEGFSGVDLSGDRVILFGPGHKSGYQLVDLSNPKQPRVLATVRTTGTALQETVRFLAPDQFFAYGWGGKALFFDFDAAKTKLVLRKAIEVGQRFEAVHREGDEYLLYQGNLGNESGVGVKRADPPEKLGKIAFPIDVQAISTLGGRVLLVGDEQSLVF